MIDLKQLTTLKCPMEMVLNSAKHRQENGYHDRAAQSIRGGSVSLIKHFQGLSNADNLFQSSNINKSKFETILISNV